MTITMSLSIIVLNVNVLNAPIKTGLKKKKGPIYNTAYKRLISDLKTHTDWKWRDGKRYFMQMELWRSWGGNTSSDKIDFKTMTVTRD